MSSNLYILYVLKNCDSKKNCEEIIQGDNVETFEVALFIIFLIYSILVIPFFYIKSIKKLKCVLENKSYCITTVNIIKMTRTNIIL